MTDNRAGRARERAGLTIGQAAKLLGITAFELHQIEHLDLNFVDFGPEKLADLYQVRVEWLTGEVELRDYTAVDGMRGAEGITSHDRDVVAEFAASIPMRVK